MWKNWVVVLVAFVEAMSLPADANVFSMGGGLTSLEFVTVGDPGNVADTRVMDDGTTGYGTVNYTYKIGKFEVTAGQYTAFLNAVAKTDTYALYDTSLDQAYSFSCCNIERTGALGSYTYSVASEWANRPVNCVSWGDAARFANWLHNGQPSGPQNLSTTEDGAYYLDGATSNAALLAVTRKGNWKWAITSEDEWYKAAYYDPGKPGGAGYWDYPTRSNTAPGQDMTDTSGNNANYYTAPYAYPIDSGKYTTLAGEFQNSDSPYGTFDQGGNVYEWNEASLYNSVRGLRGGSWNAGGDYLHAADRFSIGYLPSDKRIAVGFRVSQVPEPASIAVLALGGLAILRRRR
ncbi:MAG: SUMF1/EgtB/PvdO family nonheme iron enzyme [Planctomycetota bacterium]|nr:SUMF1/EgtB/PvdO family nonheme iron enzyme [Planctomycetota bacterium]